MAPKLDRIAYKDPRSRNYGIRPLLSPTVTRRSIQWAFPRHFPLNQGEEGACVGFGWCAELATAPIMYMTSNDYAFQYYKAARSHDRAMGNNWPEGASVLAGAKVAQKSGMVSEYRWAFGLDDVVNTLIQKGPVVLGVNWYESMYETDVNAQVVLAGDVVGGHCITAIGYHRNKAGIGECVAWLNSWGPAYGRRGVGYVRLADLDRLLDEGGEACIATDIRR